MASAILGTLVQVESAKENLPVAPQRVKSRTYPAVPQPDPIELEPIKKSANDGLRSGQTSGQTTPRSEFPGFDLEMSRPASPADNEPIDGVVPIQSMTDPYMNRFRLTAVCLMNFLGGLNDSAPGALLPYMESYYHVGYAIVSLVFVGNALGFILAAPFIDHIVARLGRGKTLGLSQLLLICAYIPLICAVPFPVIVICFFLYGFGFAVSLAINNVFCASLRNATTCLGFMHGSYGIGGTIAPLIATALVTRANARWSFYYCLPLGVASFSFFLATWSFWSYESDLGSSEIQPAGRPRGPSKTSGMLIAFTSKVVMLGAIFIFAYQGAEVSISGWVISFLIATRNGRASSVGYVTSGFWGGITLGRFVLSPLGSKIGEKTFVYCIVVGAAIFELLVWLVPNVIGDAVSLAIVGLLLGPVYPCAAAVFTRNLSRQEQVSGLGVISAFGSSGGALAPFTTGILAQAVGTFVMHPIAIGLFAVMMGCWFGIPAIRKRSE